MLVGYTLYNVARKPGGLRAMRHKVITATILILWILATVHISLAFRRLITAFILEPANAIRYLGDISQPINRVKDIFYITSIVISDSVVAWRCIMVWNKNIFITILSITSVISTTICGYGAISQYFKKKPSIKVALRWGSGLFVSSMLTIVILTLLTAFRIWWLSRAVGKGLSGVRYTFIVLVILESGLLLAAAKVTEYVLFKLTPGDGSGAHGLNALYIIYECMPQISGLVPTGIIAVVNSNMTKVSETSNISGTSESATIAFAARSSIHPEASQYEVAPKKTNSNGQL
ncbi:hypothetical protein AMATHDRAFT_66975 [Amanita thiersii Skay4041]|uniref:Integral membrane protein n=1 Tax=Amanita thiersii Skay4041 TaxID=703135 RepID=A0A2A9NHJ4_9AGAR|nr:hypothetical protein AMATHDRAFT_66975 [Amanita thiersii Skay4041]